MDTDNIVRVNVPDIRDVLKFWEMKEKIIDELLVLLKYRRDFDEFGFVIGANLIRKIESIGKKEIGK